ncbi:MAG: hypothetical protein H6Q65_892 [Firmicutes bacterium]|nr:hypothetical protein [Bacillota bacterium]
MLDLYSVSYCASKPGRTTRSSNTKQKPISSSCGNYFYNCINYQDGFPSPKAINPPKKIKS